MCVLVGRLGLFTVVAVEGCWSARIGCLLFAFFPLELGWSRCCSLRYSWHLCRRTTAPPSVRLQLSSPPSVFDSIAIGIGRLAPTRRGYRSSAINTTLPYAPVASLSCSTAVPLAYSSSSSSSSSNRSVECPRCAGSA